MDKKIKRGETIMSSKKLKITYMGDDGPITIDKIDDAHIQGLKKVSIAFDSGHDWEMDINFNNWYIDEWTKQTPKSCLGEFVTKLIPGWFKLLNQKRVDLYFYTNEDYTTSKRDVVVTYTWE